MFYELKGMGKVDEIVIPPKKNWRGERYGFVRFINVENVRMLEVMLDNLWLESRKLKENVTLIKIKLKNFPIRGVNGVKSVGVGKGSFCKVSETEGNKQLGGVSKFLNFANIVKKDKTVGKEGEHNNIIHVSKSFFYNSNQEERNKFKNAKVGIVKELGFSYGVSQSLLEEGIFTIIAIPLGSNVCLLEETSDGDLELLLNDAGDWKQSWFKEVRNWRKTDVECYRAVWLSIYGILCFVRNKKLCESLLSDVGIMANYKSLEENSTRTDVTKIKVFTDNMGHINKIINVCVNGEWCKILLVEDVHVTTEKRDCNNSDSEFSSDESEEGGEPPEFASGGKEELERENDVTDNGLKEGQDVEEGEHPSFKRVLSEYFNPKDIVNVQRKEIGDENDFTKTDP